MAKVADRVSETSVSTGVGPFTLLGAQSSRRSFNSAFSTNDEVYYCIHIDADWEIGIGTFIAPATLERTSVLKSSNSNALVNFSAGTKTVFCCAPSHAWDTIRTALEANAEAISNHINQIDEAHSAGAISFAPNEGLNATDVQSALEELEGSKADTYHTHTFDEVSGVVPTTSGGTGKSLNNFMALGNYADDVAAAANGVSLGELYRTGSIIKVRVT